MISMLEEVHHWKMNFEKDHWRGENRRGEEGRGLEKTV